MLIGEPKYGSKQGFLELGYIGGALMRFKKPVFCQIQPDGLPSYSDFLQTDKPFACLRRQVPAVALATSGGAGEGEVLPRSVFVYLPLLF